MSELALKAMGVLTGNGYRVERAQATERDIVVFEDESLTGILCVFRTPQDLIAQWPEVEQSMLTRFGPRFRLAGDKAWNVYCVFLTEAPASEEELRRVSWVEEDLARTRKIAACGVRSREDIINALLPVLPLQNQFQIAPTDVSARLRERFSQVVPAAADAILDDSIPFPDILAMLREAS